MINMEKRTRRERERAKFERDVVAVCKKRVSEMADEEKKNCDELKSLCIKMAEEIRLAADAGEDELALERMLNDYDLYSEQQKLSNELCSMFNSTANVLTSLLNHLDTFMRMGWHRAIIRFTPEKKLPKLISSEKNEDVVKVMAIVTALNTKIQEYLARRREETERFKKESEKRGAIYEEMKSESMAQKTSVKDRIAKLTESANSQIDNVMPVPAKVKNQINNLK